MPSWSITSLPQRLSENSANRLSFFDADGERQDRAFPQVLREALGAWTLLAAAGCRKGGRCAVMGASGYDWAIAALACLFAGVEVVALPESLGDDDARAGLDDLSLDCAVLGNSQLAFGCFEGTPKVALEGLAAAGARTEAAPLSPADAHFSWVAFTSGTTASAKVKSFRLAPECTEHFIEDFCRLFGITHDDVWLICHPFSHVVHFEYLLGGLGWGYDVTLADPLRVALQCAALQPAVLITVPSVYQQLATKVRRALPTDGLRGAAVAAWMAQDATPSALELAKLLRPVLMPEVDTAVGTHLKVMIIGAAPSSLELRRFLALCGLPVFEGYGMSETQMLTCNVPGEARFGTVGRPWPGVELAVEDDGRVLVRLSARRTTRYLNVPQEESLATFGSDGWIQTGDLGELRDGFLSLYGRAKEVIITDRGKNVNPAPIEQRLSAIPGVSHALVFGDQKPFLVAVLAPQSDEGLDRAAVEPHIARINSDLPQHEHIVDFVLLASPLTTEARLLTGTGKPRRTAVEAFFRTRLEALYA
ncbi:AMP-binding protein [Blastococcus sp. CCUG 61487]|uniref:AMP-binding protein n=1 Tax=Blastococcus sp. CCUG 61487 TaxID=1840703 RepID=UPI001484D03B|nr:AMP-binding protein [Blastococcus sp. CCUG 61487]